MPQLDDRAAGPRVAVLGTGIMGSAMARNLVAAGLPTAVWDGAGAAPGLTEAGATVAPSADWAVRDADVVITMLPTPDAVNSVIFDGGAAGAFRSGAVWAQMGTIGEAATVEFAGRLSRLRPDVLGRAGIGKQGTRGTGPVADPRLRLGPGAAASRPGVFCDRPQDPVAR